MIQFSDEKPLRSDISLFTDSELKNELAKRFWKKMEAKKALKKEKNI